MRNAPALLLGFVIGFMLANATKPSQPQVQKIKAVVTRVIDGDTFDATLEGTQKTIRVRVIGYDAPEKEHPFGDKAALFLQRLIEGKEVLLEADVQQTDKYGRHLYHVWIPNVLLSELMLLSGLGQQMTIPPNVKHVEQLTKAQQSGRAIGLGLWAGLTFPSTQTRITPQVLPNPQVSPKTTSQPSESDIVYITKTGSKYHRQGCRYLRYSAIPVKRSEAIAKGYGPCSVCKP